MDSDLKSEYLKVIESVRSARIREGQSREDAYLKVSSGALVVSISFLTISGFQNLTDEYILILSWVFLLFSITLTLISYIFVDRHFEKYENDLRDWQKAGMNRIEFPKEVNCWTKLTRKTNYISYTFTILGMLSLMIFGIVNIMTNKNNSSQRKENSFQDRQKFAEPIISGPSLSDRLKPSTGDQEKPTLPTEDSNK